MTELTKETEEEAIKLRIPIHETKSKSFDLCGATPETLINIANQFIGRTVHIRAFSDDYSGDQGIEVSEIVKISEEECRKRINRYLEHQKLMAKQQKLAKMTQEERLTLEIKELEKKLAKKKKKLNAK